MQRIEAAITREAALAAVEGSPKAVAAHDKAAWLALFADLSVIEDPVGSRPHVNGVFDARSGRVGNGAADRFYDTFIAPNDIAFDVANDVVCGRSVLRDLDVCITMAPAVVIRVPMHLLYDLDGTAKIAHLGAYWELVPMVRSLIALGPRALPVATALGVRQVRNLGLGGLAGFAAGARSAGRTGKAAVTALAEATRRRDLDTIAAVVEDGVRIEMPGGDSSDPAVLVETGIALSATKLLASGSSVSATLHVDDQGEHHRGVGLFDFDRRTGRICRIRLYWERDVPAA